MHVETPKSGPAELLSTYWPRQGEHYLIFSHFSDGRYQAAEKYRVVPLGLSCSTNALVDKPVREQIKILLQRRLDNLNREVQEQQEEKQRLEAELNQ